MASASSYFADEVSRRLALPTQRKSVLAPYFDAVALFQGRYLSPSPTPSRSPSPEPTSYPAFQQSWSTGLSRKRSFSAIATDCHNGAVVLSPKRRRIATPTGVSRGVREQRITTSATQYSQPRKTQKIGRHGNTILRPRSPNNSIRRSTTVRRSPTAKPARFAPSNTASLTHRRSSPQHLLHRQTSTSARVQSKSRYSLRRTPARTRSTHRSTLHGS